MSKQFLPDAILYLLLSYPAMVIAAVLLICLCVLLVVKRKTLTIAQKVLIGAVVLLCLVYLSFIVWLSLAFAYNARPHGPGA